MNGKDWSFVTMSDYQADMKESTDRAVEIIDGQRKQIRNLELWVGALIVAAGGTVNVPEHLLQESRTTIVRVYDIANRCMTFTARQEEPSDHPALP